VDPLAYLLQRQAPCLACTLEREEDQVAPVDDRILGE